MAKLKIKTKKELKSAQSGKGLSKKEKEKQAKEEVELVEDDKKLEDARFKLAKAKENLEKKTMTASLLRAAAPAPGSLVVTDFVVSSFS